MKTLILSLIVLASASANACLPELMAYEQTGEFSDLTVPELRSMAQTSDYKEAVHFLCNKDHSNVSAAYLKSKKSESKVQELFKRYQAATDVTSRTLAMYELQQAQQDWSLMGFKNEVAKAFNQLHAAKTECRNQQ